MNKNNKFIDDLLIFDAHCDTANVLFDQSSYFIERKNCHFTIEKAKKGGVKAQFFALYVNPVYAPNRSIKQAILLYHTLEKKLFSTTQAVKVTSIDETKSAIQNNKLACWLSLEGGHIIEDSTDILEFFFHLGFRSMTLTHSKNTNWADSSNDKPIHDGLNKLGQDIIKKMNKIGMIIDISHSSDKTVEDVLEISSKPIMASHSCARAICDIPRNIPDTLVKEIAVKKGYIGINFYPGFLRKNIYNTILDNIEKNKEWFQNKIIGKEDKPDRIHQAEMELCLRIIQGTEEVNSTAIIDHITHIADTGGIDCIGLGSDFDGIPSTPTDLRDVSCYTVLVEGLKDKGFNQTEIRKIMGLNLFNFIQNSYNK